MNLSISPCSLRRLCPHVYNRFATDHKVLFQPGLPLLQDLSGTNQLLVNTVSRESSSASVASTMIGADRHRPWHSLAQSEH